METNNRNISQHTSLSEVTRDLLVNLFINIGNEKPNSLYKTLVHEIERPLLEASLKFTKNNQTKAAKVLGLSRNTFRLKMKLYDLLAYNLLFRIF